MRHSLAVFLIISLAACSSTPEGYKEDKSVTADDLYIQARISMRDHNYEQAIKKWESLQSRFPYGRYAQQSLIETAYAYFKQGEPAPALSAADRFLKQYPNNPHTDYVYYLKGIINFHEDLGVLSFIYTQDPSEQDQTQLRDSFEAFKELVTRFPDSKYAPDARVRMQYLINTLADSELHVATYYLRRGAYLAAVNRAKFVLSEYSQSPQTRDALQVMVAAYNGMNLTNLRDDAQRVLDASIVKDGIKPTIKIPPPSNPAWWKFWKN
jgi:outer membrane protein assembly factor BamD